MKYRAMTHEEVIEKLLRKNEKLRKMLGRVLEDYTEYVSSERGSAPLTGYLKEAYDMAHKPA